MKGIIHFQNKTILFYFLYYLYIMKIICVCVYQIPPP